MECQEQVNLRIRSSIRSDFLFLNKKYIILYILDINNDENMGCIDFSDVKYDNPLLKREDIINLNNIFSTVAVQKEIRKIEKERKKKLREVYAYIITLSISILISILCKNLLISLELFMAVFLFWAARFFYRVGQINKVNGKQEQLNISKTLKQEQLNTDLDSILEQLKDIESKKSQNVQPSITNSLLPFLSKTIFGTFEDAPMYNLDDIIESDTLSEKEKLTLSSRFVYKKDNVHSYGTRLLSAKKIQPDSNSGVIKYANSDDCYLTRIRLDPRKFYIDNPINIVPNNKYFESFRRKFQDLLSKLSLSTFIVTLGLLIIIPLYTGLLDISNKQYFFLDHLYMEYLISFLLWILLLYVVISMLGERKHQKILQKQIWVPDKSFSDKFHHISGDPQQIEGLFQGELMNILLQFTNNIDNKRVYQFCINENYIDIKYDIKNTHHRHRNNFYNFDPLRSISSMKREIMNYYLEMQNVKKLVDSLSQTLG